MPAVCTRPSATHLVLIPSYNPGPKVYDTVREARACWNPVWVVDDGSTDGSTAGLIEMATQVDGLRVLVIHQNQGKGAAVLLGLEEAARGGFTHALCMDADGPHSAALIPEFMERSQREPAAMVLGVPVFDDSAAPLRAWGRKVSNWWANLESLWMGIGDSLYGFRVYPIAPLRQVMHGQAWMRRFDFNTEAVVRLCWINVRPLNLPVTVKFVSADEGGISHVGSWRDNRLHFWTHVRLMLGLVVRLPGLLLLRLVSLISLMSR
ncbi:MAG: glycosyltransferase family 2 protein [Pseudomonadota bacterium]